jgi:hypothetical protein
LFPFLLNISNKYSLLPKTPLLPQNLLSEPQ